MGLIQTLFGGRGIGAAAQAITDVSEVFRPNATRQMELGHEAYTAALGQHSAEFAYGRQGRFDRLMNGMNRLPRPFLALGTLGLFVFAMVDPVQFSKRMEGLAYVPNPLWWLLGAIVSFYFGARELHYNRSRAPKLRARSTLVASSEATQSTAQTPTENPALEAWRARRGG
jgi:hypothetical protein